MKENQKSGAAINLVQNSRWLTADTETPISLFMRVIGQKPGILLESAEVDGRWGRYSILATNMCFFAYCESGKLRLKLEDERFQSLALYDGMPYMEGLRAVMAAINITPADDAAKMPPITRALYGYMGFEMAALFNPVLQADVPLADANAILALPTTVLVFDHLFNRLCQLDLGPCSDPVAAGAGPSPAAPASQAASQEFSSLPDEAGYKRFVNDIREQLRNGEAIQVVPSTRFSTKFSGDPFQLYRAMRRLNASPYMFYMRFPEITLFGSSPEVMVRCSANSLLLAPIAGTRRRGDSDAEDATLARELLDDPKECAEHVMLVDLGRNDLGRIARPGSLRLEKYQQIEKYSHVMHMTSRVTAMLDDTGDKKLDALDVLQATFPAGTVSGAPKIRAIQIIRALEGRPRGPYGGCIGWIGLDQESVNLDMGITIRSMWLVDGTLYWQAGGGIVHDSDPQTEWMEVCNKSAIMRKVLLPEED